MRAPKCVVALSGALLASYALGASVGLGCDRTSTKDYSEGRADERDGTPQPLNAGAAAAAATEPERRDHTGIVAQLPGSEGITHPQSMGGDKSQRHGSGGSGGGRQTLRPGGSPVLSVARQSSGWRPRQSDMATFFNSLDENADGVLAEDEIREFVRDVGGSTLDDHSEIWGGVSKVMDRLDTDSEEGIGLKELSSWISRVGSVLTVEEAADWVTYAVQLPQEVAEAFRSNSVSGYDFPELVEDNGAGLYYDLGIKRSYRKRIVKAIEIRLLGLGDEPLPPTLHTPTYLGGGSARIEWSPHGAEHHASVAGEATGTHSAVGSVAAATFPVHKYVLQRSCLHDNAATLTSIAAADAAGDSVGLGEGGTSRGGSGSGGAAAAGGALVEGVPAGGWVTVHEADVGPEPSTAFVDSGLAQGKTYVYRLRSWNLIGHSEASMARLATPAVQSLWSKPWRLISPWMPVPAEDHPTTMVTAVDVGQAGKPPAAGDTITRAIAPPAAMVGGKAASPTTNVGKGAMVTGPTSWGWADYARTAWFAFSWAKWLLTQAFLIVRALLVLAGISANLSRLRAAYGDTGTGGGGRRRNWPAALLWRINHVITRSKTFCWCVETLNSSMEKVLGGPTPPVRGIQRQGSQRDLYSGFRRGTSDARTGLSQSLGRNSSRRGMDWSMLSRIQEEYAGMGVDGGWGTENGTTRLSPGLYTPGDERRRAHRRQRSTSSYDSADSSDPYFTGRSVLTVQAQQQRQRQRLGSGSAASAGRGRDGPAPRRSHRRLGTGSSTTIGNRSRSSSSGSVSSSSSRGSLGGQDWPVGGNGDSSTANGSPSRHVHGTSPPSTRSLLGSHSLVTSPPSARLEHRGKNAPHRPVGWFKRGAVRGRAARASKHDHSGAAQAQSEWGSSERGFAGINSDERGAGPSVSFVTANDGSELEDRSKMPRTISYDFRRSMHLRRSSVSRLALGLRKGEATGGEALRREFSVAEACFFCRRRFKTLRPRHNCSRCHRVFCSKHGFTPHPPVTVCGIPGDCICDSCLGSFSGGGAVGDVRAGTAARSSIPSEGDAALSTASERSTIGGGRFAWKKSASFGQIRRRRKAQRGIGAEAAPIGTDFGAFERSSSAMAASGHSAAVRMDSATGRSPPPSAAVAGSTPRAFPPTATPSEGSPTDRNGGLHPEVLADGPNAEGEGGIVADSRWNLFGTRRRITR